MTVISCDLRLVTDKAASVTEMLVRAPKVRATGVKTVVTAPDRVPVTNGTASFTALPGACVVTLVALGTPIATMDLLVPDVASATLVECILAGELAENAEVSELRALSEQVVSQIAGKVDKVTYSSVVLATSNVGAQTVIPYSQSATAYSIAQRDSGGRLNVGEPTSGANATTKTYVDGQVATKANVSHTHTLSQITDAPNSHTSNATASTLMSRDSAGRAQVANPAVEQDIANKGYVDGLLSGKVDKVTYASVVLATSYSGAQTVIPYSQSATAGSIAQRHSGGRLAVSTPVYSDNAATKGYVDGLLSALDKNTVTVETEAQATALTGLRVGDYVQVLATGNIYKVV